MDLRKLSVLLFAFLLVHQVHGQQARILVLIHSDQGGTYALAQEVAKGIEAEQKATAVIKKVQATENPLLSDIPVATVEELTTYHGIAFGSPIYFGNISTPMSAFLAKTVDLWSAHALEGVPATVFMSAGSGAGKELAIQAFWNSLAVHGMVLVPSGIMGYEKMDKAIPQGNTVLGTTSLASLKHVERPTKDERYLARLQGQNFAKIATALMPTLSVRTDTTPTQSARDIQKVLEEKQIKLPAVPKPAGSYEPYVRSGNLIFINQVALENGKVVHPGKLGLDIDEKEVNEATRVTMLNVLSVLNDAVDGDLNKVKKCVQMTGIFNTKDDYTKHANLMNVASDLMVDIFGEKGKHARATYGASSIPLNSSVEIQAIFEVE